jgi:hypothetical protein
MEKKMMADNRKIMGASSEALHHHTYRFVRELEKCYLLN